MPASTTTQRWEAARARAERLSVRLHVLTPRRRYWSPSQSADDVVYTLELAEGRWRCDCPGFTYSHVCKHLAALERRARREGWRIALD